MPINTYTTGQKLVSDRYPEWINTSKEYIGQQITFWKELNVEN